MTTPDTQQVERATPAEQAKAYATKHGFMIKPVERRYHVMRAGMPLQFIAEVGGYPAALNAMKRYTEAQVHCDVVSADGALGVAADTVVGAVVLSDADHADMLNDPARTVAVSPAEWARHKADSASNLPWSDQRTAEMVAQGDAVASKALTQAALFHRAGITAPAVRVQFDDFDARLRKAAQRIARQRRRASGKPPGGPWHVIFDGKTVMRYGYPTRSAAIAVVRSGFNHPETLIRNNWRTKAITVEYRP